MSRRIPLLVFSLAVAALCARFGVWQLDRRAQRQTANAEVAARLAAPPVDAGALRADGDALRYRRVTATGTFDLAREVAHTARARHGSPGVHFLTPLVRAGTDTLLLVVRGWAYSPDAATVDFGAWAETGPVQVSGFAMPYPASDAGDNTSALAPRAVRRVDRPALERQFGAPLAGYYVVMTGGGTVAGPTGETQGANGAAAPARLTEPALDDGPHLSYAVQWFLFAAIFAIGGAVVALRTGPRTVPRPGASDHAPGSAEADPRTPLSGGS